MVAEVAKPSTVLSCSSWQCFPQSQAGVVRSNPRLAAWPPWLAFAALDALDTLAAHWLRLCIIDKIERTSVAPRSCEAYHLFS